MAEYFVSAELPYFQELREAFRLLRLTGCRIQEIFEIYRWRRISGYQFEVIPQKKNSPRTIILDDTFSNFMAAVDGQFNPFLGRTYSQLQYLFTKINPWGKLYSGGKEITNYFFRYLYVRELAELGLTSTEIATEMGYSSTQAVNNYLNAELGSTNEVPVIPSDPIPTGHIDPLVLPIIFTLSGSSAIVDNPFTGSQYTIHFNVSDLAIGYPIIIGPYQYNIAERSLDIRSTVTSQMMSLKCRPINQYLQPDNLASGSIILSDSNPFTFRITENLLPSGKYLSGSILVEIFVSGVFVSSGISTFATYSPKRASHFLVNGRRSSSNVYQSKGDFTLNSLYFWDRGLSDAEILTLANQ